VKFSTNDRGRPKTAGPAAIVTFATIIHPALWDHLGGKTLVFKLWNTVFLFEKYYCTHSGQVRKLLLLVHGCFNSPVSKETGRATTTVMINDIMA